MTEVSIPVTPTGSEAPSAPAADPNRPAWLPEKFATPEDMAKSYAELETKVGAGNTPPEGTETPDPNAAPEQAPDADAAQEAVTAAGLDFDALSSEYAEKGELSAENMAALEKAGISKTMVEQYAAGQKAMADNYVATVTADIGGPEAYTAIVSWAAENMSGEEVDAYNAVMDSGNEAQTKIALAGLKARYDAANGSNPKLMGGKTVPAAPQGYRSKAEMVTAMADRRYKTDPAYRADVAEKLQHTDWM